MLTVACDGLFRGRIQTNEGNTCDGDGCPESPLHSPLFTPRDPTLIENASFHIVLCDKKVVGELDHSMGLLVRSRSAEKWLNHQHTNKYPGGSHDENQA